MGNTTSSARVTEPVTLPRIWAACQMDSSMPDELKRFNINLLVDDMNKLGANIPVGKRAEETCRAIEEFIPHTEKVCMVGKAASKDAVYRTARQFNNQYGSRISIYKNGVDKTAGYRDVADVCDDMYMVQRRVYRALNNNTLEVKNKLYNSILQLRAQQKALDDEFKEYRALLARGSQLDQVKTNIKKDLLMQQQVVNQINQELSTATSMYKQFVNNNVDPYLKNVGLAHSAITAVHPTIVGAPAASGIVAMTGGAIDAIFNGGKKSSKSSRDNVDGRVLTNLVKGNLNLGLAMRGMQDCFKNLNTTYEEYLFRSRQPIGELEQWVAQKAHEAQLNPSVNNDMYARSLVGACAAALVDQKDYTLQMEGVKGVVKDVVNESCAANNIYTNMKDRIDSCSRDSMCAWIDGSCKVDDQQRYSSETTARYITFNEYTERALMYLRAAIEDPGFDGTLEPLDGRSLSGGTTMLSAYTGSYPNTLGVIVGASGYANELEQLITDKVFTQYFDDNIQPYTHIKLLMQTRSSDAEGIRANEYMSHMCGDVLKYFAKYLKNKYSLKVVDNNQETFLAEVFAAYCKNESHIATFNVNKLIPSITKIDRLFREFYTSEYGVKLFAMHDAHIAPYINPSL